MFKNVFNCDSENSVFMKQFETIIDSNNVINRQEDNSKVLIGEHFYKKNLITEELDVIIRLIRREWYLLQNLALNESSPNITELEKSRENITKTFQAIIECLKLCDNANLKQKYIIDTLNHLSKLESAIIRITDLDNDVILKLNSTLPNDNCSLYQYFHSYLEINYFSFSVYEISNKYCDKFEERLKFVISDLICLNKACFARNANKMVFRCECIKRFWFLLQLLSEKHGDIFWKVFNDVLEQENPLFSLWILKEVANLQTFDNKMIKMGKRSERIKPNYDLIENKLKLLLIDADSDSLKECFTYLEPLTCGIWLNNAKIEIYQIIWDFYSKRLNVTNKTYSLTAIELSDAVDNVLYSPKDCSEDFEFFVAMLVCHLQEYPLQWGKMKGRIYSQLGPNKVKDLTDVGVSHVMILFMALATTNYEELSKKIISFLESLPPERKSTTHFWNMYTSYILRQTKEGRSIENVAKIMVKKLEEASLDQKSFKHIKQFMSSFECLINNSLNMHLHQWLLLGNWITNYISKCYFTDLTTTLNTLLLLVEKTENPESWSLWEESIKTFIYPSLKNIANTASVPGTVGKIAAKISLLIPSLTAEAFDYFNSEVISPGVSAQFLNVVLKNYPTNYILTNQQESIAIQSWVKVCLLTIDSTEELTKNIFKLDYFPSSIIHSIKSSRDSLVDFIEFLGGDDTNVYSPSIIKLCETCFGETDKWITCYLTKPESESVVLRLFTLISLTFLHCGALLYNRHKSTCPLTRLISAVILPNEFLFGKPPHPYVLNAIKRTWHLYFEALVKINGNNDSYIERTKRDFIVKYMPFFSTGDSPMLKCLDKDATATILLEKISAAYFNHPTKEQDANILKALKIIFDYVESTTSVDALKIIVNKTLYGFCEVVIFHAQRNTAIGCIKTISGHPLYSQVSEEFRKGIMLITDKHLAFNTSNYFQLLNILSKFIPQDLKLLLSYIKQQIANVERLRGVGFDKHLRQHLEKLEKSLDA